MSDHSIVKQVKECTKKVTVITSKLLENPPKISAHEVDSFAKAQNSAANTYNSMVKMAIFNAQHHPSKEKPYFNFD